MQAKAGLTGNLTFQTFQGKARSESQEQQLSVPCLLPTINAILTIHTGKFATQGIILQKLDSLCTTRTHL